MYEARPSTASTASERATSASTARSTVAPPSRPSTTSPDDDDQAPVARPPLRRPRTGTHGTLESAYLPDHFDPDRPPRLDFAFSPKGPLVYLAFLLTCNVLIPCLLFYLPRIYTTISDKELIGIGSASLGLSSCFDAPLRFWRLTRWRKLYGPLYYADVEHLDPTYLPAGQGRVMRQMPRNWWHLDFSMWTYQIGLFFFAIPLAVAPAIPLYNFFLFSTAMLVAPIGLVLFATLRSWPSLPFWMSSDPPRTRSKPACYYFVEDVGAVDFKHGREWRKRMQARWASSPPFRRMCWQQTLYWACSAMVYTGITAAVIWAPTPLSVAYGLTLGLFFAWVLISGLISYFLVHWSLVREREWWRAKYSGFVPPREEVVGGTGTDGSEMTETERTRWVSVGPPLETTNEQLG